MANTKKDDLEEITRAEFVDYLFDAASDYDSQINALILEKNKLYQVYNRTLIDQNNYDLKYYIKDDTVIYTRELKKKIGFKK
jgi:hypothetical protein